MNTSVARQKGKSQNGCFKKTKHVKFSEKRTFLTPDTHYLRYISEMIQFPKTPSEYFLRHGKMAWDFFRPTIYS